MPPPLQAPSSQAQAKPISQPQAKPISTPSLTIEEPEYLDEAEIVEDDDEEAARSVPSLEPPRPPTAAQAAERAKVDVWALAEGADEPMSAAPTPVEARTNDVPRSSYSESSDITAIEEIEIDEIPPDRRRDTSVSEAVERATQTAAQVAAPAVAAAAAIAVPGVPHDELVRVAREIIERIAWEVVPELAETIIRAELDRLTRERE